MATIKFKTNAKCGGCVAAIGAKLNTLMASDDWSIDLADPNKVLEVNCDCSSKRGRVQGRTIISGWLPGNDKHMVKRLPMS